MTQIEFLTNKIVECVALLNAINTNAKTNDEIPIQTPIDLASTIRVYRNADSKTVTIQNIIDAAVLSSTNFNDRFTNVAGLVLDGNDLTVNPSWSWIIDAVNYSNPTSQSFTIPFAATGNNRIDLLVAVQENAFAVITGVETAGIPAAPTLPNNTLQATFLYVTDSTISEPTEPQVGIDHYFGSKPTESEFIDSVRRTPVKDDFGFVINTGVFKLAFYNGASWIFVDLLGGGVSTLQPLEPLEVRVFKKASGNTGGYTKEVGDWVYGEPYEGIYWAWAIVGSDPNDYNTYEVKSEME